MFKKREKFISLLIQTEAELLVSQKDNLEKHFGKEKVIGTSDYLIALGELPMLLIAHLDRYLDSMPMKENIISSKAGIGGDDRCGIYMINEIISRGYKPFVLLTTGEESGCQGVRALIESSDLSKLESIKYAIQLDRRGVNDAVFYGCPNQEFVDFITNTYDWDFANGSSTDIRHLCPAINIAGVNLSVGYFNEHKLSETVDFNITNNNIEKVIAMLEDAHKFNKWTYFV